MKTNLLCAEHFGIEEEFFVVDINTRQIVNLLESDFFDACEILEPVNVVRELPSCVVEIKTPVTSTISELRENIIQLRSVIHQKARERGLAIIASGTHPISSYLNIRTTPKEYYRMYLNKAQLTLRKGAICGMHLHIEIPDEEQRFYLFSQFRPFLPFILALSTSSPFWHGIDSGLVSFRRNLAQCVPHGPMARKFDNYNAYKKHIDTLLKHADLYAKGQIFWDVRMSPRYPTLEVRIMDVCTRVEDALAIASLCICLVKTLNERKKEIPKPFDNDSQDIESNLWLAERYPISEGYLIDFPEDRQIRYSEAFSQLCDFIGDWPSKLKCEKEIQHIKKIIEEGTSAELQRKVYQNAINDGLNPDEALRKVVDWIAAETTRF